MSQRECNRRYRKKHAAKLKEYARRYRERNRDKANAWAVAAHVRWRERNPDRYRTLAALRAAEYKKRNIEKVRARDRATAPRRDRRRRAARCGCCTTAQLVAFYSARPPGYQADHITALALGGKHCVSNLQYLTVAQHLKKTRSDMALIAAARKAWLEI